MEVIKFKKAIISPTEIVILRKKGDITIKIEEIVGIGYAKPTLLRYLWWVLEPGGSIVPGRLEIYVGKKILTRKMYSVKIKYNDVYNLPEVYRKIIGEPYYYYTDPPY